MVGRAVLDVLLLGRAQRFDLYARGLEPGSYRPREGRRLRRVAVDADRVGAYLDVGSI